MMGGIDLVRVRATPDGRLKRADAAEYLGKKPKTLAMWKCQGRGPRSVTVGGHQFYYITELDAYIRGESADTASKTEA